MNQCMVVSAGDNEAQYPFMSANDEGNKNEKLYPMQYFQLTTYVLQQTRMIILLNGTVERLYIKEKQEKMHQFKHSKTTSEIRYIKSDGQETPNDNFCCPRFDIYKRIGHCLQKKEEEMKETKLRSMWLIKLVQGG